MIDGEAQHWVDAQFAAALEVAAEHGRSVSTVLDVGAHVGLFARRAIEHGCRVVAGVGFALARVVRPGHNEVWLNLKWGAQ